MMLSLQNNTLQEYFRQLFSVTNSAEREQHAVPWFKQLTVDKTSHFWLKLVVMLQGRSC